MAAGRGLVCCHPRCGCHCAHLSERTFLTKKKYELTNHPAFLYFAVTFARRTGHCQGETTACVCDPDLRRARATVGNFPKRFVITPTRLVWKRAHSNSAEISSRDRRAQRNEMCGRPVNHFCQLSVTVSLTSRLHLGEPPATSSSRGTLQKRAIDDFRQLAKPSID